MSGDWFDGNGSGGAVDVAELIEGLTVQGIVELVAAGALVSIGTTSDGGALSMTVTADGKWRREYFRAVDELRAWIAEAIPAVEAAKGISRPSSAPRGRARRSKSL